MVINVQVENVALDVKRNEEKFILPNTPSGPVVALAFKLEEGKYGQLTYVRVYSGTLTKGSTITNVASGKRHKVPRLVRTHSDELEDVDSVTVRACLSSSGPSADGLRLRRCYGLQHARSKHADPVACSATRYFVRAGERLQRALRAEPTV